MARNLQVVLASRPKGEVVEDNFRIEEVPLAPLAEGQLRVRNHWLSLDPYMRGRMEASRSYARAVEIGEVMVGGTVGEVVESRHPAFHPGDEVAGALGWQEYGVSDGKGLTRVDSSIAPSSYYLGILGMPGVTAWVGLMDVAQARAGETVVVSAASGAVGSVVGQIARIQGCHVVGIAGGPAKCGWCANELGYAACIDYKAPNFAENLRAALPRGVDVLFENVGGEVMDTALRCMNPFSRIALCGMISTYDNGAGSRTAPAMPNLRSLLVNRIRLQGFIVTDKMDLWPRAISELAGWLKEGRLRYRETVAQGLGAAPRAFIGLLRGENFGKQLVKLT